MSFKRFLIWSSGDPPPVQWSGSIYAILKEGIIGNIHVKLHEKLHEIRISGSGNVVYRKVYGQTDDRQRPITIAHLESSAQVS